MPPRRPRRGREPPRRRARRAGVHNIVASRGDAERLPYPDGQFDAAYLIGVLGEIPDQTAALRELRRVLKPEGRLVIGEFFVRNIAGKTLRRMKQLAEAEHAAATRRAGPA